MFIGQDATVREAAELMLERGVSALPVQDQEDRLVGIISEGDLVRRAELEVFRGANALQYGSTTLGGAVNYVSPTGYDSAPLLLRGEVGSYGYFRGQAAIGGVNGATDYYLSLSNFTQDGYQDHSKQSNDRMFGNFGRRINENLETRFSFVVATSDSGLPGNLTKSQLLANPQRANPDNVAGNQHRDFSLYRMSNKTTYAWGGGSVLRPAFIMPIKRFGIRFSRCST